MNRQKPWEYETEKTTRLPRLRRWWELWWDETLVIIGVSTALILLVWGLWFLFQTMPLPLESGKIVGHDYTAEYEEWHDGGTSCWSYNKDGSCSWRTDNPDIHHVHCRGGCFEIQVYGCSNDRRGDEHCRNEWMSVNQFTYTDCRDGRLWHRNQEGCKPQ